jgi:hypothetical protein
MEYADKTQSSIPNSDNYIKIEIPIKPYSGKSYFKGLIHLTQQGFMEFITLMEIAFIFLTLLQIFYFHIIDL